MGRPFKEEEKINIKSSLVTKGRDLFVKKGLKGTTVEELTRISGIAQGSFYTFYSTKEELYFDILELEEKEIGRVIEEQLVSFKMTRKNFKRFLLMIIDLVSNNPLLITLLNAKDYQALISKIPKNKYQKHLDKEYLLTSRLFGRFQNSNHMKKVRPEILSGLLHALFLLQLHSQEIGTDIFQDMFELLVDMVSDTIVFKGARNLNETEDRYS